MKQWYVVQVYTGYEGVVKNDLEKRIVAEGLQDLFGEVLVPTGEVGQGADDSEKKEKIFPGYVLVQMEMVGEAFRLVTSMSRVSKFLGGDNPMPLSDDEVERIYSQMSGKIALASEKETFVLGGEVNISSGPFAGFVGIVDTVNEEQQKLIIMVSIFGRMTPVELGFDQVKR